MRLSTTVLMSRFLILFVPALLSACAQPVEFAAGTQGPSEAASGGADATYASGGCVTYYEAEYIVEEVRESELGFSPAGESPSAAASEAERYVEALAADLENGSQPSDEELEELRSADAAPSSTSQSAEADQRRLAAALRALDVRESSDTIISMASPDGRATATLERIGGRFILTEAQYPDAC